jgi:aldehyde dehydrogenase (NAD+)
MTDLPEFRNLIGGELRQAASGRVLDSINPATGEVWARIPASDKSDVEDAVAAAVAAFPAWSGLPEAVRGYYLRQIARLFPDYGEEFSDLERQGIGVIPKTAMGPLMPQLGFLWERAAGETLQAVTGKSVPMGPESLGFTRRQPYGVVACIIPYNAPLPMACSKMAVALAAGNTVVLKPPEQASASILRLGELLAQLLPPGVVNIVAGLGAEVGDPLVRHRDVRKITMTGSTGTAKAIQRAAADNLTSAVFELGGKSPQLVFADADLDRAIHGLTELSVFTANSGQACVAGARILVQRPIVDEVVGRLEAFAKAQVVGDPVDPATTMGPLISRAQFDKVVGFIEDGRTSAKLLFGGRHGPDVVPSRPGGYWVEPTLFLSEDNGLRINQEEIFGPVAVVIPFDTDEQAIAIANDTRFGLAAGVWTRDMKRAYRMVRDLNAGNVWVNTYLETRCELPFGGIKESGYGHDEVLEFTFEKAAVIAT